MFIHRHNYSNVAWYTDCRAINKGQILQGQLVLAISYLLGLLLVLAGHRTAVAS